MAGNARSRREERSPTVKTRSAVKAAASTSSAGSSRKNAASKHPSGKAPAGSSLNPATPPAGASPSPSKTPSAATPNSGKTSKHDRGLAPTKKKSGSPVRRSGRLEHSSKIDGKGEGSSSGGKSAKKKKGILPAKRNREDADRQVKQEVDAERPAKRSKEGVDRQVKQKVDAERPAKMKKLYHSRDYRMLYQPLRKMQKKSPVSAKKFKQRNSPEENLSHDVSTPKKGGSSFENGNLGNKKDRITDCGPDNARGEDAVLDKPVKCDAYVREELTISPVVENGNQHVEHVQSAVPNIKVRDGALSSKNSKRSKDLMQKRFSTKVANDSTNNDKQMGSKCRNILVDSLKLECSNNAKVGGIRLKKSTKSEATAGVSNGDSCSENDVRLELVASGSEEGSVASNTGYDGGGHVESSRGDATKVVIDSDVSASLSKMTQAITSADAPCGSLSKRGCIEFGNDPIGKNTIADNVMSFQLGTERKVDNCLCPICKQPETQLLCKGKDCKRSYHLSCVDPPLIEPPPGIWLCLCCVRKKIELGIYSVSEGIEYICQSRLVETDTADTSGLLKEKQYLVKYAGLAHIHNRWISEKEAFAEVPYLVAKYNDGFQSDMRATWRQEWCKPQRLLRKRLIMPPELFDEYFYGDETSSLPQCYYEWFVKWTGLGYDHATWELESSLLSNVPEAEVLIKEHEARRIVAKESYDPSRCDKIKQIRKNPLAKLSTLSHEFSAGLDISGLNFVNKLRECWHAGRNSVLVNDQDHIVKMIMFISTLLSDVCQPFLIITSMDSISRWESEMMRLMPTINYIIYEGHRENRKLIRDLEFYEESGCIMFKVLLSHADAIAEDFESLDCLRWEVVVVDNCQLPIVSRYFDKFKSISSECRLLLLDGHLKDDIAEYLNMLSFLDSEGNQNLVSPSAADASARTTNLALVKQQFDKYCINERKQVHSRFLEFWVPVRISNVQLEHYCAMLFSNSMILQSHSKSDQVGAFRDILLSTRKCCDHPFLCDSSLNGLLTKGVPQEEYLDVGVHASGKLRLLDKVLQELKSRGLRVLVLFQVTGGEGRIHIGDILDDFLRYRFGAESYERVDSGLAMTKKQAALQKFNNKDSGRFVFLLENRACLPSIKLSAVDAVIIYGSDWNPLNDIKSLQRISISSQTEQIKVFRLYSVSTVEEMALLLTKKDVVLESNIPNISRSTGHLLLRWGACHLFDKLEEFHKCNSPSSICVKASCEKPLLNDTLQEVLQQLSCVSVNVKNDGCSIISKVQLSGTVYCGNIVSFGESEKTFDEDQPHIFWSKLLDGRHPKWRYVSEISQRARRKVQPFGELPVQPTEENDEARRKRRKLTTTCADTNSMQPCAQDKTADIPTVKDNVEIGSQVTGVSKIDSEGTAGLRDLQRSLCVRLKPEIAVLCGTLQLSEEVKDVAEMYLEYIMNHHRVSQEPQSLLHAFMVSLCWRAAHFSKIKVDYKKSLSLARKNLNFECNEEEVVSVYSKLRMLKKAFPRPTNVQSDQSAPIDTSDIARVHTFETCTPCEVEKLSGMMDRQMMDQQLVKSTVVVKSERDKELCMDNHSNMQLVSQTVQDNGMLGLKPIQNECPENHDPDPIFVLEAPEVEIRSSLHCGSGSDHVGSGHGDVHPEGHGESICLSSDLYALPPLSQVQGSRQIPDSMQPTSMPAIPNNGNDDTMTSAREDNAQMLDSPVDAPPLQSAESFPLRKGDGCEVDLDGSEHQPEHVSDSTRCVGENETEFEGRNTGCSTKTILESSILPHTQHSYEHGEPAMSTPELVHCVQVLKSNLTEFRTQQLVLEVPLIEQDHSMSVTDGTPSVPCPTLPVEIAVADLPEERRETEQQETIMERSLSANPLLELETVTAVLATEVRPPNSPLFPSQFMPSSENACSEVQQSVDRNTTPVQANVTNFPSSDNQAIASWDLPSGGDNGVSVQNHDLPVRPDLDQLHQPAVQDSNQQQVHSHATTSQEPHRQPFQINASLPSQGLHPDPLQNELLRISKEKEFVNQSCDDMKLKLRLECQIELEKVKKKYEELIQNVDVEFTEKKKMLDMIYNKVVLNRILAEEFRFKFSENARAAAAKAVNQQGVRLSTNSQQFLQSQPWLLHRPVASSLTADFRNTTVTQRSSAVTATAPTSAVFPSVAIAQRNSPIRTASTIALTPSVTSSQRLPPISSIISSSVTIPTAPLRRPPVASAPPSAVSIPPAPTIRIPSIPSAVAVTAALPSLSISTHKISPIASAVPSVVSIPTLSSFPSTVPTHSSYSGSEPENSAVAAPPQVSVPVPPLQIVNNASALFSSNSPSAPFIGGMSLPHGAPQSSSLYRSPAPHLSFRPPASIRLSSPVQSGGIPGPHNVAAPDIILRAVPLQAISAPLPSSIAAVGIHQTATSSVSAEASPQSSSSEHDVPNGGGSKNEEEVPPSPVPPPPVQMSENDWIPADVEAFVLSDGDD